MFRLYRFIQLSILALICTLPTFAQTTSVTITVQDTPDNQTWNNGLYGVKLIGLGNGSGPFNRIDTSAPVSQVGPSGALSAIGQASFVVVSSNNIAPANTMWQITVCPQATAGCFIFTTAINGATQSLTISPPSIRINLIDPIGPYNTAYTDTEIATAGIGNTYYNLTSGATRQCIAVSGSICLTWTTPIGGGGGANPVGNNGDVQVKNGSNLAAGCINAPGIGPANVNCQTFFKGPSPHVDMAAFGGRTVSGANYAVGQLIAAATCSSGSFTLSSVGSNTLFAGDGIAVYGCGTLNAGAAPAAPVLTPSIAATRWHTGLDVPQPAGGAVQVCYVIEGETAFQGFTPKSTEVCANTYALGPTNAAITSAARSGTTIIYTMTSNNPSTTMAVGQGICISGTNDDAEFGGCFTVSAVTSTTFSVVTGNDAGLGASIAATGGTAFWAYDMNVTLPAVSGTTRQYLIFAGATGAEVAYGWSLPFIDGVGAEPTNLVFQDFGSTITKFNNFAPFVPTTPSSSAVADTLSTTVQSVGSGIITMTNQASQNFTSTVRLDESAILAQAITFAQIGSNNNGGMILLNPSNPALGSYIFNTPITVPQSVTVSQAATVNNYDTITVQGEWFGDQTFNGADRVQVSFARPETKINCIAGYPCVNHRQGTRMSGITIAPTGNGAIDLLYTGGNPPDYDHLNLVDSGSPNCNVIGFYFASDNAFGFDMNRMAIMSSYQPGFGNCDTPMLISKFNSEMNLHYNIGAGRGYFFYKNGNLTWDGGEEVQGGGQCTFTFYNNSIQGSWVRISNMIQDTIGAPLVCFQGAAGLDKHDYEIDGVVGLSAGMPLVSGNPVKRLQVKGVGSINNPVNVGHNTNLTLETTTGAKYQSNFQYMPGSTSGVGAGQLANPTVAPVATLITSCPNGHPPAGGHGYQAVFYDALGVVIGSVHSTAQSPSGGATTDGATNCVSIAQPTPPVGAVSWYALRDGYVERATIGGSGPFTCSPVPISNTVITDQDVNFNSCAGSQQSINTSFLNGVTPGGFNGIELALSPIPNAPTAFSGTNLFHLIADGWPAFNVNLSATKYFVAGITGTVTPGHCVNFLTTTAIQDAGAACNANITPGGLTDALQYNGGGNTFGGVNSPIVNGNYLCGYVIAASAAAPPTCNLPGIPVNLQVGSYTLLYSDRASHIRHSGGTTATDTLGQIVGNFASNFPFVEGNFNSGNLTLQANAADKIDGSATGGTQTVFPGWAAYVYQDSSSAPGNWWTIRVPMFSAFPNCTGAGNALQFVTATGVFGCGSSSSGVSSITGDGTLITNSGSVGAVTLTLGSFAANKVFGNCTGASATPTICSLTDAMMPVDVVLRNQANTYSGGGLQDFSAMVWKIPTSSGFTAGATTMFGYDSLNKNCHVYANNADSICGVFATTPVNKQMVQVSVASNNVLLTGIDHPERFYVPAANCNNTTGGAGWSIGSGGSVICRGGTNNKGGAVQISDVSTTFAQLTVTIPEDWDTATNPFIRFYFGYPGTDTGHTIIPAIQVSCSKGDGTTTDDVTFNASHSSSTTTTNATANQFWSNSFVQMNAGDVTGCVAGALMTIQIGRATDTATSAVNFYGVDIIFPRLLVVGAE